MKPEFRLGLGSVVLLWEGAWHGVCAAGGQELMQQPLFP